MLRPERMSRVSVAGATPVMDDVIETVHSLNLVHLSEYDGTWEGFEQGDPDEAAEDVSQKLVTVRSLKSILDVDADAFETGHAIDDLERELESVRTRANDLDDRRSEIEDELRTIEERVAALEPFIDLGVDLDLLEGYDTLVTTVGVGDAGAVRAAVADADGIADYEVIAADDGDALAVFARPESVVLPGDRVEATPLEDALVGVEFERLPVPEYENPNPEVQRRQLENRREQLESRLGDVEGEIAALREETGAFLLAAEERLAIQVQKAEAPLSFATTTNSFVAEGWVPTERVDELESALRTAVGDRVEFEELERAEYHDGRPDEPEPVEEVDRDRGEGARDPTPAADGGRPVTMRDPPPTSLNNPETTEPAEVLVKAAGVPKYSEFDPTALVFLTFPVFFGFMIGDLGYGLLYTAIGYGLYTRTDSPGLTALGGLGLWSGIFTVVFGVLYGEVFGLHVLGDVVWHQALNTSVPMHKGLQPKYGAFASAWLIVSATVGLLHVGAGHLLGFLKQWYGHSLKDAVLEKGSWLLLMFGFWVWLFSRPMGASVAASPKPTFLFTVFADAETAAALTPAGEEVVNAYHLGFSGFPEVVAQVSLVAFGLGGVLLVVGEGIRAVEFLQAVVNVLSYARLMAVLLAKAGLAFVVNLLVFGAYVGEEGEYHFIFLEGGSHGEVLFGGLLNADGAVAVVGLVAGLLLLVVGHLFVLALGVTSAGLQGVRLEYVEFFGKFYDGGGRSYDPFGYSRNHTTDT